MSKTYSDFTNKINDWMRDSNFVSNHTSEALRAVNDALEDVNSGRVGDKQQLEVGYEFQREIQDVLFTTEPSGTITTAGTTTLTDSAATFETEDVAVGDRIENTTDGSVARVVSIDSETELTTSTLRNGTLNVWTLADAYTIEGKGYAISSSWNFKFPINLRLAEDSDVEFILRTPEYFKRKKYVSGSGEFMYSINSQGNSEFIEINYDTTEALYFEFFSNNIVKDASGTRKTSFVADTDILLIPDRYWLIPVKLAVADLFGQLKGWEDVNHTKWLTEGRRDLMAMINNIGTIRKKPSIGIKVRSEWVSPLARHNSDD